MIGFLTTRPRLEAPRETIANALWPGRDEDSARHCLATTLWRAKSVLDADAFITTNAELIALRIKGSCWIDALAFDRRVRTALRARTMRHEQHLRLKLARALDDYGGDFLPLVDSEWALYERERLHCLRLDGLYALAMMSAHSNDWARAMGTARTLCALEPLREDAHRLLMTAYAQTGNRALALKQFRTCAAVLQAELAVDPMEETAHLYRQILGHRAAGPAVPARPAGRVALVSARDAVRDALGMIEKALADHP
ncbi:bacterial transcriptional activator domain-containing protein [Sphingomonas qilianensis]|uniref:Bacterial transcriptional activator domain-containing protein n=1 Tax=Sphingomonas qilianensis TaxID=1736690 RepID=A0ABU9XRK1_9SPHN